jgi:predicted KAP-like P-loop ATPase
MNEQAKEKISYYKTSLFHHLFTHFKKYASEKRAVLKLLLCSCAFWDTSMRGISVYRLCYE